MRTFLMNRPSTELESKQGACCSVVTNSSPSKEIRVSKRSSGDSKRLKVCTSWSEISQATGVSSSEIKLQSSCRVFSLQSFACLTCSRRKTESTCLADCGIASQQQMMKINAELHSPAESAQEYSSLGSGSQVKSCEGSKKIQLAFCRTGLRPRTAFSKRMAVTLAMLRAQTIDHHHRGQWLAPGRLGHGLGITPAMPGAVRLPHFYSLYSTAPVTVIRGLVGP